MFNARNVSSLARAVVYNAVGADADTNGNVTIDLVPDEFLELRTENADLSSLYNKYGLGREAARASIDAMYQCLRLTSGVSVTYTKRGSKTTARLNPAPAFPPADNDTMVTVPSALGAGGIGALLTNTNALTGGAGRNHASVANAGVATTVGPWIIAVEKSDGDLKSGEQP